MLMLGFTYRRTRKLVIWSIPLFYALIAIGLGYFIPNAEFLILSAPGSRISVQVAIEILSAIGQGMLALTAIVFSIMFIQVQFGSSAYSPRLVGFFTRDRVILNALGVFIGTFLFALVSLSFVDQRGSGAVPYYTVLTAFLFLFISIIMFTALIQRLSYLQVTNVLNRIGRMGQQAVLNVYSQRAGTANASVSEQFSQLPVTQELLYHGDPLLLVDINLPLLVRLAQHSEAVINVRYAIGDFIQEGATLLRLHGASRKIWNTNLRRAFTVGSEQDIYSDPKYAIRLLVDIAIKALSPAINDPTTAVQALNQIEGLLVSLGNAKLETGRLYDKQGELRVVYPSPSWHDFINLGLGEIFQFGKHSMQVLRRLGALIDDLEERVPRERRPAVRLQRQRLLAAIEQNFPDELDQQLASRVDRQGLGISRDMDA
jgi:uncharacterized membrane protein